MNLLLLPLFACASEPAPVPAAQPAVEVAGPEVELVRALELGKRIVDPGHGTRVFNFWATWCGPCKKEMPLLRDWAAAHPDVEVVLVSLDLPKLQQSKVIPYLESEQLIGLTNWQLDDPDPAAALPRAVPDWPDTVPVTLVVDDEGRIVRRFHASLSPADLEGLLP